MQDGAELQALIDLAVFARGDRFLPRESPWECAATSLNVSEEERDRAGGHLVLSGPNRTSDRFDDDRRLVDSAFSNALAELAAYPRREGRAGTRLAASLTNKGGV
jgi:hypothetical protein